MTVLTLTSQSRAVSFRKLTRCCWGIPAPANKHIIYFLWQFLKPVAQVGMKLKEDVFWVYPRNPDTRNPDIRNPDYHCRDSGENTRNPDIRDIYTHLRSNQIYHSIINMPRFQSTFSHLLPILDNTDFISTPIANSTTLTKRQQHSPICPGILHQTETWPAV